MFREQAAIVKTSVENLPHHAPQREGKSGESSLSPCAGGLLAISSRYLGYSKPSVLDCPWLYGWIWCSQRPVVFRWRVLGISSAAICVCCSLMRASLCLRSAELVYPRGQRFSGLKWKIPSVELKQRKKIALSVLSPHCLKAWSELHTKR